MLLLSLISAASAYESEPQDVVLQDLGELYTQIEYETGYIPSGSPVAVNFYLEADGGAAVEMFGESWVVWPDALTHGFEPEDDSGFLSLDSTLSAGVALYYDIFGYTGTYDLTSTSVSFFGAGGFSPWVLPGGAVERVEVSGDGVAVELFNLDYEVISGVGVYLVTDLYPEATAAFEGVRFTTNGEVIELADASERFDPPSSGDLELETVFTGLYEGALAIVLEPSVSVCISILGCYDVATFEWPIELVSSSFEQDFYPVSLVHPVPALSVDDGAYDFGEVDVGQISTYELDLTNLGTMALEGALIIEGTGEFSVFPDEIWAGPDQNDGVVVTFAPTVEGVQAGKLVMYSSDPSYPVLEIPLTGNGYVEEAGDTGGGEMVNIPAEVGGCGCAAAPSSPAGLGAAWALALVGLAAARRRD